MNSPTKPNSKTPRRTPLPFLLGGATFLIFVTIALYLSRGLVIKYLVNGVVQKAAQEGLNITIQSLSAEKLEMDIESLSPELRVNNILCLFEWNLFSNSIKVNTHIPFNENLANITFDLGFFRNVKWNLEIERAGQEKHLPLSAKGEIALIPPHLEGDFRGSKADWSYEGEFDIRRKDGKWVAHSHPQLKWKGRIEINPELKGSLAETSNLEVIVGPKDLKSDYLTIDSPLRLEWQKAAEEEEFKANVPSLKLNISSPKVGGRLSEAVTILKRKGGSETWQVDGKSRVHLENHPFFLKYGGELALKTSLGTKITGRFSDPAAEIPINFQIVRKSGDEKTIGTVTADIQIKPDGILAKVVRDFKKEILLLKGGLKLKSVISHSSKKGSVANLNWKIEQLYGLYNEVPLRNLSTSGGVQIIPVVESISDILLKAERMGSSLTLDSFHLKATLRNSDKLAITDANGHLAGGTLVVSPFSTSISEGAGGVDIKLTNLSLEALLRSVAGDRLSGTGFLDGAVKVNWKKEGMEIPSFRFVSVGKGKLSYREPVGSFFGKKIQYLSEFQSLIAEGNQALVMKALENFEYDRIEMNATRTISGKLDISLNLKGRNPDLIRGQPFDITLPVSGDVESFILKSVLQSSVVDEVNKHRN